MTQAIAQNAAIARMRAAAPPARTVPISLHDLPAPRTKAFVAWALARLAMGWIFLWAFADKLVGLGFATARQDAWIHGGSPTLGFLSFGTKGPLAGLYQPMAGHPVVDAVFMAGLLGIGTALVLGIGLRIAAVAGAALMVMMWSAALPPDNNPLVDDHIVYALVLLGLAAVDAGRRFGLGIWWAHRVLGGRHAWLR